MRRIGPRTDVACGGLLSALLVLGLQPAGAAPTVVETTVLGPFTGAGAPLHPDNLSPQRIAYYGTDLGWSYAHRGRLEFLFGDTMATEAGERIEASTGRTFDDAYGSVDLERWPDGSAIGADNMPLVYLGQHVGSTEAAALNPGHAMESFKTPIGGFSNGIREFGIFYAAKPRACRADADCGPDLSCDQGLGYTGEPSTDDRGITLACRDGSSPSCIADTMRDADGAPVPGSGLCSDPTSSVWADSEMGRAGAAAVKLIIGVRDTRDRRRYIPAQTWLTNKFSNSTYRTVERFEPADDSAGPADYRPARGAGSGRRVFIWGRPGFIGVGKRGRPLGLYFAYVEMPEGEGFHWRPQYFAGVDDRGRPRFSGRERDAVALDLDATRDGVQADAEYDIVDQVSVAWVEHLDKWLMFYGGGMIDLPIHPGLPDCGVLQLFTGPECRDVDLADGAFRMRTADHPWGPWTPAQDLIVPGDPSRPEGQYGAGGMLRHPDCTQAGCAPHTAARESSEDEYGFFYSANIIAEWITPAGGGVDVIWNASTWDPYRVILLRTRIDR